MDLALDVARRMVGANLDLKIEQSRRAFIYMPFMHSENLADQSRCVALADQRLNSDSTLHHAREHRKLIERFGRFPHRNKILETDVNARLNYAFLSAVDTRLENRLKPSHFKQAY